MRLAFVSDIHLSDDFDGYSGHDWVDEWLEYLSDDDDVDHLTICGDFVGTFQNPGNTDDFDSMRSLLKRHDWYNSRKSTVVPGNHDTRWMGNLETNIVRGVHSHFRSLFGKPVLRSEHYFPSVKRFDGVHLISLDTVTGNGKFTSATGELCSFQRDELERVLAFRSVNNGHVIIAMHHPPMNIWNPSLWLWDRKEFWDIVDDSNVDLVVCGHDHASWEKEKNGVPVVCVGGFLKQDMDALIVDAGDGELDFFWWDAWE